MVDGFILICMLTVKEWGEPVAPLILLLLSQLFGSGDDKVVAYDFKKSRKM
jgi:hypothetical protein